MRVYTVHAPVADSTGDRGSADRLVFVRDGFSFWALIAGWLWFAVHRLWLALAGYLAIIALVTLALKLLNPGAAIALLTFTLIALLVGLEANNLRRWTLSRGKWRQLDVVVAENEEAAERRFFDRWSVGDDFSSADLPIDPGAAPPTRSHRAYGATDGGIVGLFPQPGAPR